MDVIMMQIKETPAPPHQHWPEIPRALEAAILRCLNKDPEQRFHTVEELLRDLEALSA
jgi:serine/threonine-protein kinase